MAPSSQRFSSLPNSQTLTVGPGAANVNFTAYQINALSLEGYTHSALQLGFAGGIGQSQVLEVSSNFFDWFPVLTNVVGTNGILQLSLTNNVSQPREFYRIRSP